MNDRLNTEFGVAHLLDGEYIITSTKEGNYGKKLSEFMEVQKKKKDFQKNPEKLPANVTIKPTTKNKQGFQYVYKDLYANRTLNGLKKKVQSKGLKWD